MKKITYCFALLLLTVFGSHGQVQLGDGTAVEKGIPFEPENPFSYTQSIYLSSEILATGTISSLQWYYTGANTLAGSQELTVYIGHTTKSEFTSTTDWEPIANLTEAYAGGIVADGPGWLTVVLDTPFEYNGTDNLVIAVKESSVDTDFGDDEFYTYQVAGNRSLAFASWSEAVDAENPEEGSLLSFVPNISLDGINQACPKPVELIAQEPTTTGITLSWISNADAVGGSEYYISTSNTTPTPSTEATGDIASGEFAVITEGLLPGTLYYAWVRDICAEGAGTWSNSTSFITDCVATDAFFEDFDTASNGSVPICWSSVIYNENGALSGASVTVTSEEGFTGKSVEFYRNGDATSDLILVTPPVSNLGADTHRLRFYAKHSAFSESANFVVGTIDGNTPGSNFTEVGQMTTTNKFKEYVIDFTAVGATPDTYIAIKLNTTNDNFLGYVDHIRWEPAPLCADVTDVIVPVATTTTATVSWTSEPDLTQWEVVYSDSATADPSTLTPIIEANDEPTALIEGLTAETNYYVWVRSACEAGLGYWVGPVLFRTACQPVDSLNENFDDVSGDNLPSCWSEILRGESLSLNADVKISYNELAPSGQTSLELYSGFSNPSTTDDIIAVTPNLGNLSDGTHRFKFFAKGAGTLQIGTLASSTVSAVFNYFDNVEINNNGMTEYVLDFSSYSGTDTYIGIRYNTTVGFSGVLIDDVVWEPIPACPDVTDIDAFPLNTTTVALGWTATGTQWQTAHGLSSISNPNNATISDVLTQPSAEISGLSSNANYNFWVRTVCGETEGNGAWIGPFSVRTPCDAVTSFTETFESAIAPDLPSCWSAVLQGEDIGFASVGLITWQPFEGNIGVELSNAGAPSTADIILASPVVSNLSAGTHRVRLYASHSEVANLEVGTLNDENVFTFFEGIELTNVYEQYIVNFSSYTGTDTRIGFRMNSDEQYKGVNMDNIVWEIDPELSNGGFDNDRFSFYPNPVKDVLNLSYNQNITSVSVYNLLGQEVIEAKFNSNSAQINTSSFATGSYIVKVCAENQTKIIKIIKE